MASFLLTFAIMFVFWLLLSGKFDSLLFLSLGVLSSLLTAFVFHHIFLGSVNQLGLKSVWRRFWRFLFYLPWLLYQIALANIHVAYLILHPRMPIDPVVIKFNSKLTQDLARVIYANSITLTPGTITAECQDGEYLIHALDRFSAEGLLAGEMESKVAHIFREDPQISLPHYAGGARKHSGAGLQSQED